MLLPEIEEVNAVLVFEIYMVAFVKENKDEILN